VDKLKKPVYHRVFSFCILLMFCVILNTSQARGHAVNTPNHLRVGINMHPTHNSWQTIPQQVAAAQSISASIIAFDVHWAWIEVWGPNNASWSQEQITRIESFLNEIEGTDIELMAIVHEPPCWASSDPAKDCTTLTYNSLYPPANPNDYVTFLSEFVTLYKDQIKNWMIWCEPNSPYRWVNPSPSGYVSLLQPAYLAVKSIDPQAFVISGSLAPWTGDLNAFEYLQGMYQAGAYGFYDAIAYNPYTDGNTPTWYHPIYPQLSFSYAIPHIHQMMQDHADNSPLWITEIGWSTVSEDCVDCWVDTLPTTEEEQAIYTLEALTIASGWEYVDTFMTYELVDTIARWDELERVEYHFGLFRTDFSPKPAALSYRSFTRPFNLFLPLIVR